MHGPLLPSRPRAAARLAAALLLLLSGLLAAPGQTHALCFSTGAFGNASLCWNPVNPLPDAFDVERVVWSPERAEYLAVGAGGAILTSPDGVAWTVRDSGTVQRLFGALWDGLRYVVVGDGGLVLTSSNGADWTARASNTRVRLLDIAVNTNRTRYVVVGESGTVLSSPDTVTWTETIVLSLSRRPALYGVVWHTNRFVAVGSSSTIITSENGTDWIEREYSPLVQGQPPPPVLRAVTASSNGLFVAVGTSGTAWTSNNGVEWTRQTISGHPDARLRAVVWIGGPNSRFLAFGDEGTPQAPLVLSSPTGIQWSVAGALPQDPALETLKTVAFDGTNLVTGGNQRLLRATAVDLDWQIITPVPELAAELNGVIFANFPTPLRLAVGAVGAVLSSPDGLTWARETSGTDAALHGLAVSTDGDGIATRAVAVGAGGVIIHSDNGQDWQPALVTQPFDAMLAGVTWGNGLFVAVGDGGAILNSTDGTTWAIVNADGFVADLRGVAYGLVGETPRYVAVGANGMVLTSDNGVNWGAAGTQDVTGSLGTLRAVVHTTGGNPPRFVAVGQTTGQTPVAAAIHSTDGITWASGSLPERAAPGPGTPPPPIPPLRAVAWNGSQLVAASDRDIFLRSQTGQGWTTLGTAATEPPPRINALAWNGGGGPAGRFLAAGEDGRIIASGGVDIAVGVETDVSVSEDFDPRFALAGLDKTFRFTVGNIANLDALNAQFTYTAPSQVNQPLRLTDPAQIPNSWTCVPTAGGAALTCNIPRLPAGSGEAVTIEITMEMPSQSDITITHGIEVPDQAINDTQPGNNVLTVATRIGPRQAPGLPSPDTDFSSRGAFGSLDGLTLALLVALIMARLPRRNTGSAH